MLKPERDWRLYLEHMLELSRKAHNLCARSTFDEFSSDETLQLAVVHLLQTIGEAARQIPEHKRTELIDVPWKKIIGMRHKIVHDYLGVDYEVVWSTANKDLPDLIRKLELVN